MAVPHQMQHPRAQPHHHHHQQPHSGFVCTAEKGISYWVIYRHFNLGTLLLDDLFMINLLIIIVGTMFRLT